MSKNDFVIFHESITHFFEGFKRIPFYCNFYYKQFKYKNQSKNIMETIKVTYVSVRIRQILVKY